MINFYLFPQPRLRCFHFTNERFIGKSIDIIFVKGFGLSLAKDKGMMLMTEANEAVVDGSCSFSSFISSSSSSISASCVLNVMTNLISTVFCLFQKYIL